MNGGRKDINAAANQALRYIDARDNGHNAEPTVYANNDLAPIERAARELLNGRAASPDFLAALITALKPIVELTRAELQLEGRIG